MECNLEYRGDGESDTTAGNYRFSNYMYIIIMTRY